MRQAGLRILVYAFCALPAFSLSINTAGPVGRPESVLSTPGVSSGRMSQGLTGGVQLGSLVLSFSHVHLYVDHVEDVSVYKDLEGRLNQFSEQIRGQKQDMQSSRRMWNSLNPGNKNEELFRPQNRDVVKQLLAGMGFRVTGCRMPTDVSTNTRSVLVTSRDPNGVQFVVSSIDEESEVKSDDLDYFDAQCIRRFYSAHRGRQGVAVLAFQVDSVDTIEDRYRQSHSKLMLCKREVRGDVKVLEVCAYYQGEMGDSDADVGTVLRFVENLSSDTGCILPGLSVVPATFDADAQAAYCDHWVSNVVSRTGFLSTLEDTLQFTPKADFNAGVVAAGEAQIESTVTGNSATCMTTDKNLTLKDQSQVYLPINNALSEVGHVNGFLMEIGQGVQHIASRVDNLTAFVQRANDYREMTGEGFTFLQIPRSYYGTLSSNDLMRVDVGLSAACAKAITDACERGRIVSLDGAVRLDARKADIQTAIESALSGDELDEYQAKKDCVSRAILHSRYSNLYRLLHDHLSEEAYLGLVRNQILVDVQGDDLLYQIFTSNVLQRNDGEEAPFLEFIQRVCSERKDETGRTAPIKPGCGGFGIRNFLCLFLSIEVSKAMLEAKNADTEERRARAQEMVTCFTNQLNESNPILTEISDAMTEEGRYRDRMEAADDADEQRKWQAKLLKASEAKTVASQKLLECSTKYKLLMRSIREQWSMAIDGS